MRQDACAVETFIKGQALVQKLAGEKQGQKRVQRFSRSTNQAIQAGQKSTKSKKQTIKAGFNQGEQEGSATADTGNSTNASQT